MNIESSKKVLDELLNAFRFNDAVIRHLVLQRKEAITKASFLKKKFDRKPKTEESKEEKPKPEEAKVKSEGSKAKTKVKPSIKEEKPAEVIVESTVEKTIKQEPKEKEEA